MYMRSFFIGIDGAIAVFKFLSLKSLSRKYSMQKYQI